MFSYIYISNIRNKNNICICIYKSKNQNKGVVYLHDTKKCGICTRNMGKMFDKLPLLTRPSLTPEIGSPD